MKSSGARTLARVTVDLELEYEAGSTETIDWAIRRAVDEAAHNACGCEVLHAEVTFDPLG
jgi:hypothetical protein